jgi:NAD(P)-dependent dehydrogenase (short-subunit alcohol dehydrogenase family)
MKHAIVTGGSRGLGRGVVEALAARGMRVTSVARHEVALPGATQVIGDVTDEALVRRVLADAPDLVVLCAGASPVLGSFHELSWDDYSTNWNVDAKSAFLWLREALRRPLARGAHVIVVSSGAAIAGSPASGGYAPAKRAQWLLADYAANESKRADLGVRVHCVLPNLNPSTELGRAGIAAYAARAGLTPEAFSARFEPQLTPEIMGRCIAEIAASPDTFDKLAYRVTGAGLVPVG